MLMKESWREFKQGANESFSTACGNWWTVKASGEH